MLDPRQCCESHFQYYTHMTVFCTKSSEYSQLSTIPRNRCYYKRYPILQNSFKGIDLKIPLCVAFKTCTRVEKIGVIHLHYGKIVNVCRC